MTPLILLLLACDEPGFQGTEVIWDQPSSSPGGTGSPGGGGSGVSWGGTGASTTSTPDTETNDGGNDSGGNDSGALNTDATITLEGLKTGCDPGAPKESSTLTATATIDGVQVSHTGVADRCCATWAPEVESGKKQVEISYVDVGEVTCDCTCPWAFDYTLVGLPAGEWELIARKDRTTVIVETK